MASWLLNSLFDTGSSQSDEPPCSGSEIRCERNASAGCSNTTPDRPPDTGEAGPPATSENLASTRRDWCVHARPMERLQIISALVKDPCGGDSFYHGANFPNRTDGTETSQRPRKPRSETPRHGRNTKNTAGVSGGVSCEPGGCKGSQPGFQLPELDSNQRPCD